VHSRLLAPLAALAKTLRALVLVLPVLYGAPLRGQTIDDGVMMPKRSLGVGLGVAQESWDRYWEGTLERDNENIGRLTTRSLTWTAAYGVTDRLSILATLPYVRTHTSAAILQEMHGVQDLSAAAKYRLLATRVTDHASLRAIVVGSVGLPAGDYSPDFLPLSIGLGSRRASGRATLSLQADAGWFLNASTAYTWRGSVKLDRAAYYTGGQLHLTHQVAMPNVFDYTLGSGYRKGRLYLPASVSWQRTLGGSDIRRQDMPFVSNRMNFVRVDGAVGYTLPGTRLMLRLGAGRVLSGRNVGQGTTVSGGLGYLLPL
jgi:hypothetical protein